MDDIDRKILAELQRDGRLSLTDLGERIGLSLSPCHRRVRAFGRGGGDRGLSGEPESFGGGIEFSAIVFVTLRVTDRAAVQAFEDAVPQIPEIIQAQRLFGDPDFLLHVVTTDLAAYQSCMTTACRPCRACSG